MKISSIKFAFSLPSLTTSIRAELERHLGDYISPTACPLLPAMSLSMPFSGCLIFLSGFGQLKSDKEIQSS